MVSTLIFSDPDINTPVSRNNVETPILITYIRTSIRNHYNAKQKKTAKFIATPARPDSRTTALLTQQNLNISDSELDNHPTDVNQAWCFLTNRNNANEYQI